ncbi:hypothetical protein PIB30_018313 [Stylosanthes scabra]|uniref:Uncharacterized protein n=1 Tax=Stylosanthes scabra TaxID=79078 RepID=A0ABU6Z8E2_9FABA|nr:hypothetical protein [Stylosanthes scabra]
MEWYKDKYGQWLSLVDIAGQEDAPSTYSPQHADDQMSFQSQGDQISFQAGDARLSHQFSYQNLYQAQQEFESFPSPYYQAQPPTHTYEQPYQSYVPDPPPTHTYKQPHQPEVRMILGSDDGDQMQALFSYLDAERQPQPVVRSGRSFVNCLRPPRAMSSGGHCLGRASIDSWSSGGDHQRGPTHTQRATDFNESATEGEGPTEGDNNSGVVESQQQVGLSGSSNSPPYNLWSTLEKKKPSKWSPSPIWRSVKDAVSRRK